LPALIHFQEEIKGRWCEIWQKWSWENIHSQLLKIDAAMAFWVLAWQKKVLYGDAWSFKPKNNSKSLLGPYEGKLQKQFCPWGRSSVTAEKSCWRLKNPVHWCFSSL
jgi:hypothetical protein